MVTYIKELFAHMSFGREFIRQAVLILLTIHCAVYSYMGIWILSNREQSAPISEEEVALIGLYVGVNGLVFLLNSNKRG